MNKSNIINTTNLWVVADRFKILGGYRKLLPIVSSVDYLHKNTGDSRGLCPKDKDPKKFYLIELPIGKLSTYKVKIHGKMQCYHRNNVDKWTVDKARRKNYVPTGYFLPRQKAIINEILLEMTIKQSVIDVYLKSKMVNLDRVLDFISHLILTLTFFDFNIFNIEDNKMDFKIIQSLIKKILSVGAFNQPLLVTEWKTFINCVKHKIARTDLYGHLQELPKNSIFRKLFELSLLSKILNKEEKEIEKFDLYNISHLVQSRQMPYMGRKTELLSIKKFVSAVTAEDPANVLFESEFEKKYLKDACNSPLVSIPTYVNTNNSALGKSYKRFKAQHEMINLAQELGTIVTNKFRKKISDHALHFSVTTSGELNYSIRKGGQSQAVADAIREYLPKILYPGNVEFGSGGVVIENTIFGPIEHTINCELWRYLFRDKQPDNFRELLSQNEFGTKRKICVETPFGKWGYDEYLGKQIMYIAYKESVNYFKNNKYIRVRLSTVPELGNKARIISVGPWWLNTLFSPLAHCLVEFLKFLPAVWSSFHRNDQCWIASTLFKGVKVKEEDDYGMLSSDFEAATDSQSLILSKVILKTFITSVGLHNVTLWKDPNSEEVSNYVDYCLNILLGRRLIEIKKRDCDLITGPYSLENYKDDPKSKDFIHVLTNNGLLMGEALTKAALTLVNLCSTYAAIQSVTKRSLEEIMNHNWNLRFHQGGDDKIIFATMDILKRILKYDVYAGFKISAGKYGISRVAVWYTEKCLFVSQIWKSHLVKDWKRGLVLTPFHQIVKQFDVGAVLIADSFKLRLFTTADSLLLKKDNKNVALGKALSLSRSLEYFDYEGFMVKGFKKVAINYFLKLMGSLLPRQDDTEMYALIHLPKKLGGLGLGLKDDIVDYLNKSPIEIRRFLSVLLLRHDVINDFAPKSLSDEAAALEAVGKKIEDQVFNDVNLEIVQTKEKWVWNDKLNKCRTGKLNLLISRLNTNMIERGVSRVYQEFLTNNYREMPIGIQAWPEIKARYPGRFFGLDSMESYINSRKGKDKFRNYRTIESQYRDKRDTFMCSGRMIMERASRDGWISIEQFAQQSSRPNMFLDLLSKPFKEKKVFPSHPKFREVWDTIQPTLKKELDRLNVDLVDPCEVKVQMFSYNADEVKYTSPGSHGINSLLDRTFSPYFVNKKAIGTYIFGVHDDKFYPDFSRPEFQKPGADIMAILEKTYDGDFAIDYDDSPPVKIPVGTYYTIHRPSLKLDEDFLNLKMRNPTKPLKRPSSVQLSEQLINNSNETIILKIKAKMNISLSELRKESGGYETLFRDYPSLSLEEICQKFDINTESKIKCRSHIKKCVKYRTTLNYIQDKGRIPFKRIRTLYK